MQVHKTEITSKENTIQIGIQSQVHKHRPKYQTWLKLLNIFNKKAEQI